MTINKIFLYSYVLIFLMLGFVFAGKSVLAQSTIVENYAACKPECCSQDAYDEGCNPLDCREYCGDYNNIDSMLGIVIKVMGIILGLVGSLALLAFIYGGILFLTSAGSKERVEKGRKAIIGAIMGLIIVFTSYTIIGFVFKSFNIPNWNSINWF